MTFFTSGLDLEKKNPNNNHLLVFCRCNYPAATLLSSSPSWSPPSSSDQPADSCVWTCQWPKPEQKKRQKKKNPMNFDQMSRLDLHLKRKKSEDVVVLPCLWPSSAGTAVVSWWGSGKDHSCLPAVVWTPQPSDGSPKRTHHCTSVQAPSLRKQSHRILFHQLKMVKRQ